MQSGDQLAVVRRRRGSWMPRRRRAPVVVLGNPKAGTTAIAALLAMHARESLNWDNIWAEHFRALREGRDELRSFVERNPRAFNAGVIKEPNLIFLFAEVREVFPDAQFVFVQRDPRSNLRSILNRVNVPGDLDDANPDDFPGYPDSWRGLLDPTLLGLPAGTYIETLARRWALAADVYLRHRDEMTLVRYEDFVADKTGAIAKLASAVGLPARADISRQVDTQFQPKGDARVRWDDFFGPGNLALIERLCGSRIEAFGYEAPVGAQTAR